MEHNRLTIVDYSGDRSSRTVEELFLNGNKIDYVMDYSISKKANKLGTLTLVIECKQMEVVKGDLEKRAEEIKKEL